MTRHQVTQAVVLLTLAAAGGGLLAWNAWRSRDTAPVESGVSLEVAFVERDERDVQLRVWNEALRADPTSAMVRGHLAALHVQRAREGGGEADYRVAEEFARASLARRTNRNGATAVTLVSVLLAQHRFAEAREVAAALVEREPDIPQYRALLGEVAMEVGDYALADRMFRTVWADRGRLSTAPRLARWLELNGHTRDARKLLLAARDDALARRDVARETKAWFCLRVADFELRAGRPRAAASALRTGLGVEPGDPRLHAGMARVAASRERWHDAIAWGERSLGLAFDVATLALVGDAYAAVGDSARAEEYLNAVAVALAVPTGMQHRAGNLHLLDHGRRVAALLRQAEVELAERRDIYAYDQLAWALHAAGRHDEALTMMRRALALGTRDPLLAAHAEAIAEAAGKPVALAQASLTRAER